MTTYRFLSPEWIEAVSRLKAEHLQAGAQAPGLVVNATITGVPFDDGTLELHSATGPVVGWQPGYADDPDLTLRLDYYTAKALVLDSSPGFDALTQSLANGTLVIEGDTEQLRSWWLKARVGSANPTEVEDAVRAITA
jgi:hypothetical protein